ncbi:tyrosine-type recombinase/integrase [Azoarcus olearius]|uniref:Site-specific recombinase, phage integrase family n=1 Tax=Azoarcus sp. (strain BH72) TaxID=418699 RepID=A1K6M5_AZOSB|nr:site-specific integrase [Azoarcus olearius]CAL94480.1 site-specific recombinase, phage integrase family [Azoarcus olearius]
MATITKRQGKHGTTYKVQIRLKGYPAETATFDRLSDARTWAAQTETAIKAGKHFGVAKRRTLHELAEKYEQAVADSLKSFEARRGHLAYWRQAFGSSALADVSPALIAEHRDRLTKRTTERGTVSLATVNRYIATLSALFTFAVKELQWVEANPVERVRKFGESPGRVRYLSDQERAALLTACRESRNPYLYPAVVLALSTGARQAEITTLRWQQVDFARRTIVLREGETKNGAGRVLPLTGEALDLLRDLAKVRDIRDDRVFPVASTTRAFNSIKGAWDGAVKRAGISDFRWHDLRHTAASYLTMAGIGSMEVAKVLGHKTLQMTARYSHLSPERTVELGDVLTKRLGLTSKKDSAA